MVSLVFAIKLFLVIGYGGVSDVRVCEFTQDLVFGGDVDNEKFFWPGQLVFLGVNERGEFVVGDQSSNRVQVYDANGAYKMLVTGKGNGPGELTGLSGLDVLKDGRLVLFDTYNQNPKIHIFDAQFKFVESLSASGKAFRIMSAQIAPDGSRLAARYNVMNREDLTLTETMGLLTLDLQVEKELSAVPIQMPGAPQPNQEYWVKFMANIIKLAWSDKALVAFSQEGDIFTGSRLGDTITVWDAGLNQKASYGVSAKPKLYSDEEIDVYLESQLALYRANVPPEQSSLLTPSVMRRAFESQERDTTKPRMIGLISMGEGRLLVVRESDGAKNRQRADIFDKEGRHMATAEVSDYAFISEDDEVRMFFRRGKAYAVTTDENGDNFVVRYTYRFTKP